MPYNVRAAEGGKLVIIRHSGHVTTAEFDDACREVNRRIDPHNPPHLLIDVREAQSYPDKEEYFAVIDQRRVPPPIVESVTFVTNRSHSDTIEAIALRYQNCGLRVRVFCGELDALQWFYR